MKCSGGNVVFFIIFFLNNFVLNDPQHRRMRVHFYTITFQPFKSFNIYVFNFYGNGIQVFGFGTINVYNNSITSVGKNGTDKGAESIFCNYWFICVKDLQ